MEWRRSCEDELLRELYEAKSTAERCERERAEAEAAEAAELRAKIQARERAGEAKRVRQMEMARQREHDLMTKTLAEEMERVAMERDEARAIQTAKNSEILSFRALALEAQEREESIRRQRDEALHAMIVSQELQAAEAAAAATAAAAAVLQKEQEEIARLKVEEENLRRQLEEEAKAALAVEKERLQREADELAAVQKAAQEEAVKQRELEAAAVEADRERLRLQV